MYELRPYQLKSINSIYKAWEKCNSVLLQMPTGLGKTTVFSEIIRDFIKNKEPKKRVLVLVHRIELLEQVQKRLKQFEIQATSITSDKDYDLNHQVAVATIQTLIRRLEIISNISLIVVDEAHHSTSPSYLKIFEHHTKGKLKILGVTATPQRQDGHGFNEIYDLLIPSGQLREYIPEFLCDVTQKASSDPDFSTLKIDSITRDYELESSREAMSNSKVMADLIVSFKKYCLDKKTLIFAVNSAHSKDIVTRLQNEGIKIQHIDHKTPAGERRKIVENFKEGKLNAICNVEIFTEGFDCPEIDVVIMARPTRSISLYLQQAGRCLRPKADGRKGLILDHAKLWLEHGLIKNERHWSLAGIKNDFKHSSYIYKKTTPPKEPQLPKESDRLIMEEFQLEENKAKVKKIDKRIEIDSEWWNSLSSELQEILQISASIKVNNEEQISDSELQEIWNMETIDIQNRTIEFGLVPLSRLKKITRAKCSMLNYHSIKIFENWFWLEYLDLSFSSILNIDRIFFHEYIKVLNISNTQIDSIKPIRNHDSLIDLNISFSNVQNIGLIERLPKLERLSLSGLKVENISFLTNNKNLDYLNISYTDISDISFIDPEHSLTKLIAHDCQKLNFKSADLTGLQEFDCSFSNLNSLKVLTKGSRNVNLEWINISGCNLIDMEELRYCDNLNVLIADDIELTQLFINDLVMKNIYLTIHRNGEMINYASLFAT